MTFNIKKITIYLIIISSIFGLGYLVSTINFRYNIDNEQIQSAINKKIPLVSPLLTIEKASSKIENDKINILMEGELKKSFSHFKNKQYNIPYTTNVSFNIRYDAITHNFYLSNPEINSLKMKNFELDKDSHPKIIKSSDSILSIGFQHFPIYHVKENNWKMFFVGEGLKDVVFNKDHIEITLTGSKILIHLLTIIGISLCVLVATGFFVVCFITSPGNTILAIFSTLLC